MTTLEVGTQQARRRTGRQPRIPHHHGRANGKGGGFIARPSHLLGKIRAIVFDKNGWLEDRVTRRTGLVGW
jgi:hypothetical protein